jgi:predicted regulator of Ras-like GTPase activity (Roadblock/LC7/MglB family)
MTAGKHWKLWLADGSAIVDSDGVFIGGAANEEQAKKIASRHCSEIYGAKHEFTKQGNNGEHALSPRITMERIPSPREG